jgi:bacillithiol biosynthesis deacetylase BshB1
MIWPNARTAPNFDGLTKYMNTSIKLDILAVCVHPDDAELCCAGTLIQHAGKGHAVGILDLTEGELGTRGTVATRRAEAEESASIMGMRVRVNAGMRDGFFRNDEAHQLRVIRYLRAFRPEIVLANALEDRHPDHGRAAQLVADACFYAGLQKIETEWNEEKQEPWRPKRVYHMIQDRDLIPDFIIDVSDVIDQKVAAIKCFKSQFHDPESKEPATYIASSDFIDRIIYRDALLGKRIGTRYAEGFNTRNAIGLRDLFDLVLPEMA